jgi:hypothetical protein
LEVIAQIELDQPARMLAKFRATEPLAMNIGSSRMADVDSPVDSIPREPIALDQDVLTPFPRDACSPSQICHIRAIEDSRECVVIERDVPFGAASDQARSMQTEISAMLGATLAAHRNSTHYTDSC